MKLRSGQSKGRQKILDSTYERGTVFQGSSGRGTQRNGKARRDGNGTTVNRNSNIKRKGKPSCQGNTHEHNKTSAGCAQNCRNNTQKGIKNRVNSAKHCSPTNHANETLPRTSKAQKINTKRSVKTATDIFNGKCFSKEKERTITDLRSEIIRITDDIKLIYSKFTSQMLYLQCKYFKDVTLRGDTEDIVFISNYNRIIYKLKEELTKKQQDLANSYTIWNKKCQSDHVASGKQYKRYNYNISMEMQSDQWSESSTDSEIYPTAFDTKDYNRRTRSSKKTGLKNNGTMVIQKNVMYNEGGSSSETTDAFLSSSDKECRHISRRNKDACISLANLPEINLIRLPSKSSTPVCKTKRNSISHRETLVRNRVSTSEEQVQKVHDHPKVQQERTTQYTTDSSSRSSIASTIEICSVKDEDELAKWVEETRGDELVCSANTSVIGSVNDVKHEVLRLSDSVDYKIESTTQELQAPSKCHSTSATETNARPPDDIEIVCEQLSNFDIPDRDSLNIKGSINKLDAVDCKYFDTNQNCSVKVEYSISSTQDLQDPCNYSCTSATKTEAYPPDDKNLVFHEL